MQRSVSLSHLFAAAAGAAVIAASSVTFAQDQSAATTKDVIFARKIVMATIGDQMEPIDDLVQNDKGDLNEVKRRADEISVLLMAFPHLFPPDSNQWKPGVDRDPASDTFTAPEVWKTFTDFYKQAQASSKAAYDAAQVSSVDEFKKAGAVLRTTCDACHAAFMKQN